MSTPSPQPALRRKIKPNLNKVDTTGLQERALRLLVSRAGQGCHDVDVATSNMRFDVLPLESLLETLEDGLMMRLLEGAGGQRGLMCISVGAIAALVEVQLTGKVSPTAAPERAATRTDARLVQPFTQEILNALAEQPEVFGGAAPFDIGAVFAEKRLIPLALENGDFHIIRMTVDFNLGAKSGDIIFAFPVVVEPPVEAPIIALDDARSPRDILGDGRVSLRAVLHRVTMPYSALRDLKVGDCVNIPRNAPRQMRLEAEGRVVARGMLGMINGSKAVRLGHDTTTEQMEPLHGGVGHGGAGLAGLSSEQTAMGGMPELPSSFDTPADTPAPGFPGALEGFTTVEDLPDVGLSLPENGAPLSDDDLLEPTDDTAPMPPTEVAGSPDAFDVESLPPLDMPDLPPLGDGEMADFPPMPDFPPLPE